MDGLAVKFWDYIEKKWESPCSIILLSIAIIAVGLWLLPMVKFEQYNQMHITIIVSVLVLLLLVWWYSAKRLPKCPKGKVGILIAINPENKDDQKVLENDFIATMIAESSINDDLKIMVLPLNFSKKIIDHKSAYDFCNKTRSSLIIWGAVKNRIIKNQDSRVFRLNMTLLGPWEENHKIIDHVSSIMPLKIDIPKCNELQYLEITARWLYLAIKYYIALGLCLSQNFDAAEKHMCNLNKKIIPIANLDKRLGFLQHLNKYTLISVYEILGKKAYCSWKKHNNKNDLWEMKRCINQIQSLDKNMSYCCKILLSICLFIDGRKINDALSILLSCSGNSYDATWQYNIAFLYAYIGNLTKSYSFYKKAFSLKISQPNILELEEFIVNVVNKETEKYQLYFCLGIISYYAKQDNPSTVKYLTNFIDQGCENLKFKKQIELSQKIINEAKSK